MKSKPYLFSFILFAPLLICPQLPAQPVVPNDPMFSQQWHLAKIGAAIAWATTTGSSNIVVAVIDSGVDYTHPDLAANMWRNPGETGLDDQGRDKATNGLDDDGNGYADDIYGIDTGSHDSDPMDKGGSGFHGTACASIIGAVGNNGKGMAGLNWSVSLMAIRITPDGPSTTDDALVEAFEYLLLMKARGVNIRVANISFGYGSYASSALKNAHEALGEAGILQVNGAGNSGSNLDSWPQYPMSWRIPSMIVVGGSDQSDNLWPSSNYGRSTVDLAAPARGILLAAGPATNAYDIGDGNSFSGPQVSGAAALLWAANPNLTVNEVKAALFGSVDQTVGFKGKVATNGRVNVARALQYLSDTNPPAIVINASPRGRRTPAGAAIEVTFNRPMNRASVENALVIIPLVSGTFKWTDDNRSFSFLHEWPLDVKTNYTVWILGTAQDESGGTLDGNFNRVREGSAADDFVWTFAFPVANDDFGDAQLLTGASGSIQGSNRNASVEDFAELPQFFEDWWNYGSSVWYRWTPPVEGWFAFDLTTGTSFDSRVVIYTGDRLDQLLTVAGNDDYGSKPTSRASFAAVAGTSYFIVVASKYDIGDPAKSGSFKLSWYPTPPPGFAATQFTPASGIPGSKVTLIGTNFTGATSVLFNGASASFTNALTNNLDLRITAVVPPDAITGPITVVTPHGNVTSAGLFQVPSPKLSFTLSPATGLDFRWPGTSSTWVLEETEDLHAGPWTPVAQTSIMTNGETRVTLGTPGGNRFYRLKKN